MNTRWLRVAACCLLALAALVPGRPAAAQTSPLRWNQIGPLDPAVDLVDVALVSQGQAWAIGNKYDEAASRNHGVLYRLWREDGAWRGETAIRLDVPLHDIDANSPTDIWIVGDYGRMILRRDGTGWRELAGVTDQPRDQALTVIDMAPGGAEGWLAGGVKTSSSGSMGPRLYRLAGGAWSREAAVAGDVEGGIRALSVTPNAIWAFGGTTVWRKSAGVWAGERIARGGCPETIQCVEWVVGGLALDDQSAWALPVGASP
ncbi:MAG TPA: hypothetical protein VGE07_26485, partial [Herpetosiphonaceae bacterium]